MYSRIQNKISQPAPQRGGLALAGALIFVLVVTAAYFSFGNQAGGNGDLLVAYVFEQGTTNGNAVMEYVFNN